MMALFTVRSEDATSSEAQKRRPITACALRLRPQGLLTRDPALVWSCWWGRDAAGPLLPARARPDFRARVRIFAAIAPQGRPICAIFTCLLL